MRKVFVEPVVLPEPRFRDGLGIRYLRTDGTDDRVEVLRPLWDVGAMQNAIRQRVGRLATFRQARFVPVRTTEVPRDDVSTIEVVSDFVPGHRLSQYLEASKVRAVSIETSTAIHILRELLGALALLHESRGVTHGAIGPERILITPKGRAVVADYVLGPAIERLEYARSRLWREFRVPVPAGKGLPKLDDRADVVQVGATALALLAGRPIELAEYPDGLEDLLAEVGQTRGPESRTPVPPALVGWVKRALLRDARGGFDNVRDARLALEAVLSKQNAATGGAAALKSLAESFGRVAAALEAKAAAAAAEEARRAAIVAQAAALEASQAPIDASEASGPAVDSVPAFTLLSGSPAGLPSGAALDASLDTAPAADAEPAVGWRVPEPALVEDTLPTSPLLRIDAALAVPPAEEFVEEVLDLTALAGPDEADLVAAGAPVASEAVAVPAEPGDATAPVAATAGGFVEVIVDLRELNAAEVAAESVEPVPASVESAPASLDLAQTEVIAAAPEVTLPEESIETVASVDDALAALAALEAPAPAAPPDALPEWRLLADPVGANAPTIDVVEPTESLEELVAEFAATVPDWEAPADVAEMPVAVADEPSLAMEPPALVAEPPAAMVEAPAEWPVPVIEPPALVAEQPAALVEAPPPAMEPPALVAEPPAAMVEAPAEWPVPVIEPPVAMVEAPAEWPVPLEAQPAEEAAPAAAARSVFEVIVGLQEAQAAAQAAVVEAPVPVMEPPVAMVEAPAEWPVPVEAQPAEEAAPVSPNADIAAWSFVEELLHHDIRFDSQQAADDASTRVVAEEAPPQQAPVIEPEPASPAFADAAIANQPAAIAEEAGFEAAPAPAALGVEDESAGPEPAADRLDPALPADWFIEVGPRPVAPAPVFVDRTAPEEITWVPAAPEAAPSLPSAARRTELPEPEEDLGGPVFPRVAPSVRRVRAEARRRRLARIGSTVAGGLRMFLSACTAGVGTIAGGAVSVVSSAARGTVALGGAILTAVLLAATAALRGIGGTIRLAGRATVAVASGAARAGAEAGRTTAAAISSALAGAGRGLLAVASALAASARMASRAAVAMVRAGGGALAVSAGVVSKAGVAIVRAGGRAFSASARGLAASLGALGRAVGSGAAAGLRAVGLAARAGAAGAAAGARWVTASASIGGRAASRAAAKSASVAAAAGGLAARGTALSGRGVGRAAAAIARTVYFAASDIADHLPKPIFRPWYLVAALLVIVAVAGVPYARARLFTAKPAVGQIRVESARPDALVSIDGVPQGRAPLTATVPAGPHRIEVSIAGKTQAHDVEVSTGQEAFLRATAADPKSEGSIRVTSDPAGAEVQLDGMFQGTAPVTIEGVAEGPHTLLVRDRSGLVRQTVRVRAGETADATVRIRPGWLAVFAPVKLEIRENGRSMGSTEQGRILVSPGPHTIEVVSQAMGFRETRQVDIKPGDVAALTIAMPPVTIEVVAPAEAEILIDGQPVGTAPVGPLQVAVGTREILMRHPTLGERRQVVSVTYNAPVRIVFE